MKKLFYFLLLIGAFATGLSSCKKNDDNTSDEETIDHHPTDPFDEEGVNQEDAADRLNAVEQETPPRAEKTETEIVFEDTTYADPETVYETTDESNLSKLELLINGTTSSGAKIAQEESAFSWLLESVNGITVSEKSKYLFIFSLDGKYKKYRVYDRSAEWGYYYVDTDFTKIAFDYKENRFSEAYKVVHISAKGLILENKENRLVFKPYTMKGVTSNKFTPTRTYTSTSPTVEPIETLQLENNGVSDYLDFTAMGKYSKYLLSSLTVKTKTKGRYSNLTTDQFIVKGFSESNERPTNPIRLIGDDAKNFKISGQIQKPRTDGQYTFYFTLSDEKGQEETDSLTFTVGDEIIRR